MIRRIAVAFSLLFFLLVIGTSGYIIIENMHFWDAIFMTVITISTVGYREIQPLSTLGRVFTMFLILTGVGVLFFSLGTAIEYFFGDFIESELQEGRRRKMVKKLKNHYIVCGFGRVGENIVSELSRQKVDFVIIESSRSRIDKARKEGYLFVEGRATDEEILKEAGIERAKGLVAAIGTDAENVFIVLSARSISPDIYIVARANTIEAESKLYRSGANRVLSPAVIGGRRMASLLVRPRVSEYIDALSFGESLEFQIEEYDISKDSPLSDKTLGSERVRDKTGVVVVAIRYPDGRVDSIPRSNSIVEANSKIIALGTSEQLNKFEKLFLEG